MKINQLNKFPLYFILIFSFLIILINCSSQEIKEATDDPEKIKVIEKENFESKIKKQENKR
ncbi:MAG: hypothetical protein MH321_07575 [Leptospiraceae bacterium]|nr:hypothetical protein [Leptospiraceae bacterium]